MRKGKRTTTAAVLESNSVCRLCGRDAVPPVSLCCSDSVIAPSAYALRRTSPRTVYVVGSNGNGVAVTFGSDAATLRAFTPQGWSGQQCDSQLDVAAQIVEGGPALGNTVTEKCPVHLQATTPPMRVVPATPPAAVEDDSTPVAENMKGNLRTPAAALQFVTAGNATFTVVSLRTGVRYTFKVSRAECSRCHKTDCNCWAYPRYFVGLLSGPDNTCDYTYLGQIKDNVFALTRASKMRQDSTPVRAFAWVWNNLIKRALPPQTELWHEGRCGRCGRKLIVPSSVEAGIGPDCAGRMGL
jgi:hypothetical protein